MDNITHTLAGALLAEMGLKRRSRFAYAACLLGANAPDIDVFAPRFFPVEGIMFHRGPVHGVFAWPILAAVIVGMLWVVDQLRPPGADGPAFRGGALFGVTLIAVATHPFLDWLTTYAIAIFAPVSWRWYSGNAIFIIDWVYWLLMVAGIALSARRWRNHELDPGRPARVAGAIMLAYIGVNLAESAYVERLTANRLRSSGIEPTLVVAGPPPLAFWERNIQWRSASQFGSGEYEVASGLTIDRDIEPLDLGDPALARAERDQPHVRAFMVWSRMPVVVRQGGHAYLTDQRFYGSLTSRLIPGAIRHWLGRHSFLLPLDKPAATP